MWWSVVLLALVQSIGGLHWRTVCMVQVPDGPPAAVEFLLEPNDRWVSELRDEQVPDAVVDSVLTELIQLSAERHGVMCRPLRRRYDAEAIERSKSWPVQHYEPLIGWFRWRLASPEVKTSRL